ncbi:3632_t:CDS:2 [Entrophospora sp. SA101]|nr:7856_t:CDS:2 [Entrophospora sp. SA101]CAJ0893564.1 3632_t:CDS:2 [Entrophospora sp. SA101]
MPVQEFQDKAVLQHPSGSSAEVYYYGANVTSWKYDGKERLFLSKKSKLDGTRAIRGGIPLVFPQFGKASDPSAETAALPQHGFARTSNWDLSGVINDDESKVSVEFVKIHDLNNITYTDKVANGAKFLEKGDVIKIDKHTDRVYIDVPASKIHIDTGEEKFIVTKINCKDTVVWNPWIEWSKATTDIGDEEYKGMVCVEVGQVTDYVNLKAQETWKCGQILEVAANVS